MFLLEEEESQARSDIEKDQERSERSKLCNDIITPLLRILERKQKLQEAQEPKERSRIEKNEEAVAFSKLKQERQNSLHRIATTKSAASSPPSSPVLSATSSSAVNKKKDTNCSPFFDPNNRSDQDRDLLNHC